MIDGLTARKDSHGKVAFVCERCSVIPQDAYGAQNKDELVYVLICPKCGRHLGEWPTKEDQIKELKAFASMAMQMFNTK